MKTAVLGMLAFVFLCAEIAYSHDAPPRDQLRQSSWRERYSSPRVEALRTHIASGLADTEAFWREVSRQGTPLVERSRKGDKHQLVTFLWRGGSETTRVLIAIDPFTAARPQDYAMERVDRSDVWHLTVRMPPGKR